MHAEDYLRVLDSLYPVGGTPYNFTSRCALFSMSFNLLHSQQNPSRWEVYLLPFLAQQNALYDQRPTLENVVKRYSYRILADIKSLWIFIGVTTFVIISCLLLSCWNHRFQRVPETCLSPEFDLASKLNLKDQIEATPFGKLSTRVANKDFQGLKNCTITIQNEDGIELDSMPAVNARRDV